MQAVGSPQSRHSPSHGAMVLGRGDRSQRVLQTHNSIVGTAQWITPKPRELRGLGAGAVRTSLLKGRGCRSQAGVRSSGRDSRQGERQKECFLVSHGSLRAGTSSMKPPVSWKDAQSRHKTKQDKFLLPSKSDLKLLAGHWLSQRHLNAPALWSGCQVSHPLFLHGLSKGSLDRERQVWRRASGSPAIWESAR